MQPKFGSMSSNVSTVRDTLERHIFVEIYCCKIHRRKNRETHTWIHSKMNTNPSLTNASKPVARPLSSMIHGENLGAHDGAAWTDGDNKASADLKKKKNPLENTPTLVVPKSDLPFTQFLYQKFYHVCFDTITWWQTKTGPVTASRPLWLRAVVASCDTFGLGKHLGEQMNCS